MNTFNDLVGASRFEGSFKSALNSNYMSPTFFDNVAAAPDEFVRGNLSENKNVFKKDPDAMASGFHGEDNNEWGRLDEFSNYSGGIFQPTRSRHLGYIYNQDSSFYDDNGNEVKAPELNIVNDKGEVIKNPTANQIYKYGTTKDVLKQIEFTNKYAKNRGALKGMYDAISTDNLAIDSFLYPAFDPEIGWHYQEFVGTKKEFEGLKNAGHVVTNQYGPKKLSNSWYTAIPNQLTNTISETPHMIGNFSSGISRLAGLSEEDGLTATMDYFNTISDNQSQWNSNSIRSQSGGTIDNPENLFGAIGSGVGSFVQFGGLGKVMSFATRGIGTVAKKGAEVGGKAISKSAATSAGLAESRSLLSNLSSRGVAGMGPKSLAKLEKLETMSAMITAGTILNYSEGYKSGIQNGLSEDEAAKLGLATGFVNGLIESVIGPNKFAKWIIGKGGSTKAAEAVLKEMGGDPKLLTNKAFLKGIAGKLQKAANAVGDAPVLGTVIEEFSEEFTQSLVNSAGESIYDKFFAKDSAEIGNGYFGTDFFSKETFSQAFAEGIIGGLVGGLTGGSMEIAGAIKSRGSKRDNTPGIYAYVASGNTADYRNGINYAFQSGAITQEQRDAETKRLEDISKLHKENGYAFQQITSLPEESRPEAIANTLIAMDGLKSFVEDKNNHNLDDSEAGRDNLLNFQNVVTKALVQKVSVDEVQEDGTVIARDQYFSPMTSKYISKTVSDSGFTAGAEILNNVQGHIENVNKQIGAFIKSEIEAGNADVLSAMIVSDNIQAALASDLTTQVFNDVHLNRTNAEIESAVEFDRNNGRGLLATFHDRLNKEIENAVKDLDADSIDRYYAIEEQINKHSGLKELDLPGIGNYLANRLKSNNYSARKHNIESQIKEYTSDDAIRERMKVEAKRIEVAREKHSADPESVKGKDGVDKKIEKGDSLESQIEDAKAKEERKRKTYENIDESIKSSESESGIDIDNDGFQYEVKKIDNGSYEYTKYDNNSDESVLLDKQEFESIDEAKSHLREELYKHMSFAGSISIKSKIDEDAKKKSSLSDGHLEGAMENEVLTEDSDQGVSQIDLSAVFNIGTRKGRGKDVDEHNETVRYIERVESDKSELSNDVIIRIPSRERMYVRNTLVGKRIEQFLELKSVDAWDSLPENVQNEIASVVPIEYSFVGSVGTGHEAIRRSIFVNDSFSYGGKPLTKGLLESRKDMLRNILISGNNQYIPSSVNIGTSAKFEIADPQESGAPTNSNLQDVRGLKITTDSNGNLVHEYHTGKAKVSEPVVIGFADQKGVIHSDRDSASSRVTPGAPYMILPKGLSHGAHNTPVQLNSKRVSRSVADSIFDMMVAITYGESHDRTSVLKNGEFGVELDSKSGDAISIAEFLEIIVPNGEYTLEYVNYKGEKEYLRNKVLFYNNNTGLIYYGYNDSTGKANIIDTSELFNEDGSYNDSASEAKSKFSEWMIENKNYSISNKGSETLSKVGSFKVGDISYSKGNTYSSFLAKNGMVQTNLNPSTPSIYGRTTLRINTVGSPANTSAQLDGNKKKATKEIKSEDPNNPILNKPANKDFQERIDVPAGESFISDALTTRALIGRIQNIPEGSKISYVPLNSNMDITEMSESALRSNAVDVPNSEEVVGILKSIVSGIDVNNKSSLESVDPLTLSIRLLAVLSGGNPGGKTFGAIIVNAPAKSNSKFKSVDDTKSTKNDEDFVGYFELPENGILLNNRSSESINDGYTIFKLVKDNKTNTVYAEIADNPTSNRLATSMSSTVMKQVFDISFETISPDSIRVIKRPIVKEGNDGWYVAEKGIAVAFDSKVRKDVKKVVKEDDVKQGVIEDSGFKLTDTEESINKAEVEDAAKALAEKYLKNKKKDSNSSDSYAMKEKKATDLMNDKPNHEAEVKRAKGMLSTISGNKITLVDEVLSFMDKSGNPRYAWGVMNADGITLASGAETGTVFHEAFHRVSLLMLSQEERAQMYKDAIEKYNLSGKSNFEVEEFLAEKFRSYINGTPEIKSNILSRIWNNIKNFVSQFIFMKQPQYKDLQALFDTIDKGGYRFVRPSSSNVISFNQSYPKYGALMSIDGVHIPFKSTMSFYNTVSTLASITLNVNDIDYQVGTNTSSINFYKTRDYIEARISEEVEDLNIIINTTEFLKGEDGAVRLANSIKEKIELKEFLIEHFEDIVIPALHRKFSKLGLRNKKLSDVFSENEDETAAQIITETKLFESKEAFNYSAKESASVDVKSIFSTIPTGNMNPETGLHEFFPFEMVWFNVLNTASKAKTMAEMITLLQDESTQVGITEDRSKMLSTVVNKLTSGKFNSGFMTRFWGVVKNHRHNMINFYFDGNTNTYSLRDADTNKRSVKLSNSWSSSFGIDGLYKMSENGKSISQTRVDWVALQDAVSSKLITTGNVDEHLLKLVDVLNSIGMPIDIHTVYTILDEYKSKKKGKAGLVDKLTSLLTENKDAHKHGNPILLNYFFDVVFNPDSIGNVKSIINRDSITSRNGQVLSPEKFISSQSFSKRIAQAYVKTYPSNEDDSITGPENSLVYAFAKHNYLTQSVEDYFSDNEYIQKLKASDYNSSSLWLESMTDGKHKPTIETILGVIEQSSHDKGREYSKISEREDFMLKLTAISEGKYILPTLADKKTYSVISGLPMLDGTLVKNNKTGKFNVSSSIVNKFYDYFISEVKAIDSAVKTIEDFLKKNEITASQFDEMSESEQSDILTNDLKIHYHMVESGGKYKLLDKSGKYAGRGTKFRRFGAYNLSNLESIKSKSENTIKVELKRALNARINETITTLSKSGIITLIDDIVSSDNSGVGLDKDGVLAIAQDSLLPSYILDSAREAILDSKLTDSMKDRIAILNTVANYAIQSSISVMEFDRTISMDPAFSKNDDDVVKRYSRVMSTGSLARPDFKNVRELTDLFDKDGNPRKDNGEFALSEDELTNYKTMTLKTNYITNEEVYNKLLAKYVGTIDNPGAQYKLFEKLANELDDSGNPAYPEFSKLLRKDGKVSSELFKIAEDASKRILENYKRVDQTDGQTFITFKMFRTLQIVHGNWNETKERAYRALSGTHYLSEADEARYSNAIFANIQKMVYVGNEFSEDGSLSIPIYDKMSLAPIIPRFYENTDLADIMVEADKNGIGMVKFDSAIKMGGVHAAKSYTDGSIDPRLFERMADPRFHRTQEYALLRHQLNTDPHPDKNIALGVQFSAIGVSNVKSDADYTVGGQKVSGSEIVESYRKITDEIVNRGRQKFLNEIGASEDENGVTTIDKKKFSKYIEDALADSQSDNVMSSIGVDENDNYKVELSLFPSLSSIQPKILAGMKKSIIDINMPGGAFIQQSNFGLRRTSEGKSNKAKYSDDLVMFDEKGRSEIIVTMGLISKFLPKVPTGKTDKDGEMKYRNMTHKEAKEFIAGQELEVLGYRIPTQGQNSTLALVIKDILPDTNGDMVILPSEITSLTGTDFDIDKLFLVTKNMTYEEGSNGLYAVEYPSDILSNPNGKYTLEQLQNALFDIYYGVLSSPNNLLETSTPLDATTKPISKAADVIKEMEASSVKFENRPENQNLSSTFPTRQSQLKSQNMGASAGIGPMALANINHILTQMADIRLNLDHKFKGSSVNYLKALGMGNLNRSYDKDGVLIQDWTSALINAHVDAAKDPYILMLNVNQYTYSTVALLVRSGFGESSFWFVSQPIIKALASEYNRLRGARLGLDERERRMIKWKDNVLSEYREKSDNELDALIGKGIQGEAKDKAIDKLTHDAKAIALKIMKDGDVKLLKKYSRGEQKDLPLYNTVQLEMADIYLQMQEYGDAVSELITYTKVDTGSYGKSSAEVARFLAKHDAIINDDSFIKNARDIVEKTTIGNKKAQSIDKLSSTFGADIMDMSQNFSNVVMSVIEEIEGTNTFVTDSMINKVSSALKRSITREFFKTVNMSRGDKSSGIDIQRLFFGQKSVANRLPSLVNFIEKNPSLHSLKDNLVIKLLMRNATSDQLSIETGMPKMVNALINKVSSPDSQDMYSASFKDLLTHSNESIRDFGYELMQYAYLTSGGITGGPNNFFGLVPLDMLANLTNADGITYNEFMRQRTAEIFEGKNFNQLEHIRRIYRSLWSDDDVVNTVGVVTPYLKTVKGSKYVRLDFESDESGKSRISEIPARSLYKKGMKVPISIVGRGRSITDFTVTGISYNYDNPIPKFRRFIKYRYEIPEASSAKATNSDYILYENVGVYQKELEDGSIEYYPIYVYADKLGYSDGGYDIHEITDESQLKLNNRFIGEKKTPVVPDKVLKQPGTIIYAEYYSKFGMSAKAVETIEEDSGFAMNESDSSGNEDNVANTTKQQVAPASKVSVTANNHSDVNAINIDFGSGENSGLSNMAPRPFEYKGHKYVSVEQAFQHIKINKYIKPQNAIGIVNQKRASDKILNEDDPFAIKKLGRTVVGEAKLSPNWETDKKKIMYNLIVESFKQNPNYLETLLATGNSNFSHNLSGGRADMWTQAFPEILWYARRDLAKMKSSENKSSPKPAKLNNQKAPFVQEMSSHPNYIYESNGENNDSLFEVVSKNDAFFGMDSTDISDAFEETSGFVIDLPARHISDKSEIRVPVMRSDYNAEVSEGMTALVESLKTEGATAIIHNLDLVLAGKLTELGVKFETVSRDSSSINTVDSSGAVQILNDALESGKISKDEYAKYSERLNSSENVESIIESIIKLC